MKINKYKKGFTLLEILLVIAAIGILAAIVLIAINPNKQIAQARDTVRQADINTIQKVLEQYLIDNKAYPISISTTPGYICNTASLQTGGPACTGFVDLKVLVPNYIAEIPRDPQATGTNTGYIVSINPSNNKIYVQASLAERRIVIINSLDIVTSGLVLNLDAGNPASYPETGTTWTDLSGNGNNLILTNSPTWNSSGYFSTGSTGYFTGSGNSSIPTGNSNYTMIVWARQNSSWGSARGIISIGGYFITNQSNALRTGSNTNVGNFIHYWWTNDLTVSNNNAGLSVGTWFMVTAQFDGTNRRVWANTTNVGSDTPVGNNVTSTTIQVGKTVGTEYFQGDIAIAQIYNRALTPSEIQQNFNATRGRFGL